jgi:hypothetical protein
MLVVVPGVVWGFVCVLALQYAFTWRYEWRDSIEYPPAPAMTSYDWLKPLGNDDECAIGPLGRLRVAERKDGYVLLVVESNAMSPSSCAVGTKVVLSVKKFKTKVRAAESYWDDAAAEIKLQKAEDSFKK